MGELIKHQTETIHWRETKGLGSNVFTLKPRIGMFSPKGETVLRSFKKPGRDWGHERPTQWFKVVYDEDYITEWLLQTVISCFPGITHVQLREQFTKAMKLRRQREEEEKASRDQAL